MSKKQKDIVESMKQDLIGRVDEWVGMHVPAEGTEDYDSWQQKLAEIDDIKTIHDVINYLEGESQKIDDFFITGQYNVISAGLESAQVELEVIKALGEKVAEQSWSGGSWVNVYLYDAKYFVITEVGTTAFDDEASAFKSAGIGDNTYDEVTFSKIDSSKSEPEEDSPEQGAKRAAKLRHQNDQLLSRKRRAVLVIVTEWPGGTMAMKFGGAMQSALVADKKHMTLVQMEPERIFRVETAVTEDEFRKALKKYDVGCPGRVIFVEL